MSPWNTPVFTVLKRSGKRQLLHDLRAINAIRQPAGASQLGLPDPALIPADWPVIVAELKDCFFIMPLAEQDRECFAFYLNLTIRPPSSLSMVGFITGNN